jgi:hypothetical protein
VLFTDRVRVIPARTVILVGFNEPNRALADELMARGIEVHLAGDVLGRNGMMTAIHGGAAIGRRL